MKKLIILSCILIVNLTFSQIERNRVFSSENLNLATSIEERNFNLNIHTIINDFGEIEKVDFTIPTNNSEGKFTIYDMNENDFLNKSNTSINKVNSEELEQHKAMSFTAKNYQDFITSTIIKMKLNNEMILKNKNTNKVEKLVINPDKKRLNSVAKLTNEKVNVIIGGLKLNFEKIYTSDLEHTIRHSLNLFVVNF